MQKIKALALSPDVALVLAVVASGKIARVLAQLRDLERESLNPETVALYIKALAQIGEAEAAAAACALSAVDEMERMRSAGVN